MPVQYLVVSWEEYQNSAQKIAATILDHSPRPDKIVAIARGGLTLGVLLADFLRIPIATIAIQSYTDVQKQGELQITEKLSSSIKGKHILLVDDIADTGKTFLRAIQYLNHSKPKRITTVSMFYKPHSVFFPNYFAIKTDKWILLPHEITEWIYTFTQKMEKEGKSKKEIQDFLENLGYTKEQIVFVRRHHLS